jgi:hypothetical protein
VRRAYDGGGDGLADFIADFDSELDNPQAGGRPVRHPDGRGDPYRSRLDSADGDCVATVAGHPDVIGVAWGGRTAGEDRYSVGADGERMACSFAHHEVEGGVLGLGGQKDEGVLSVGDAQQRGAAGQLAQAAQDRQDRCLQPRSDAAGQFGDPEP